MRQTHPEHYDLADKWAGEACYLDDQPARVTGRQERFATVGTLRGPLSVQYSWPTVNRIMTTTQRFYTDVPKTNRGNAQ